MSPCIPKAFQKHGPTLIVFRFLSRLLHVCTQRRMYMSYERGCVRICTVHVCICLAVLAAVVVAMCVSFVCVCGAVCLFPLGLSQLLSRFGYYLAMEAGCIYVARFDLLGVARYDLWHPGRIKFHAVFSSFFKEIFLGSQSPPFLISLSFLPNLKPAVFDIPFLFWGGHANMRKERNLK